MKQDVKKLWLEALRSGEYKQTEGELRDSCGHCCLGVLSDIHHKTTGMDLWNGKEYNGVRGVLSPSVQEWAGLYRAAGDLVVIGEYQYDLATHNDKGMSFAQIARAIEEQL